MIKNVFGSTVDLLGEAIVSARYPVGESLPAEPLLCEELGVSRSVLREAVKSLVAKGLLTTGPKVGTRVMPEDQWNWFDPDVIAWLVKKGLPREFVRDLQDLRRHQDRQGAAAGMAHEHQFAGSAVTPQAVQCLRRQRDHGVALPAIAR